MRIVPNSLIPGRAPALFLVVAFTISLNAGCARPVGSVNTTQQAMQQALKVHTHFMSKHQGRGPADEAEFKKFLDGLTKKELEDMKIDDLEKAMTSPRDNQKYVIVYGASSATPGPDKTGKNPPGKGGPTVIMYEKEGKGGMRYVAYAMGGSAVEVDDARFKELVPSAK